MAWAMIDDNFPHHPKATAAGPLASYLFVCGNCYCRKYHTGGFIPTGVVPSLGIPGNVRKLVEALLAVGLWERAEGGFRVHDYTDVYTSDAAEKEEKDARRRQKQEAGRKGGQASWAVRSARVGASSTSEADFKQPASTTVQPLRVGTGSGSVHSSPKEELTDEQIGAEFQQFQAAFHPSGRRGGPLPFGYFERARRGGVQFGDMSTALDNHMKSSQWLSGKVPSLVTWLQDQWWMTRLDPPKAPEGATDGLAALRAQLAKQGAL